MLRSIYDLEPFNFDNNFKILEGTLFEVLVRLELEDKVYELDDIDVEASSSESESIFLACSCPCSCLTQSDLYSFGSLGQFSTIHEPFASCHFQARSCLVRDFLEHPL